MSDLQAFGQKLRDIAARVEQQLSSIATEEATKHAFVLPVLQALGYDVFNPAEVVPEFNADVGIKKGEKVDYALMREGKPVLLVECKSADAELSDAHGSQLYRYFSVTPARIGLLTNGLAYHFFSDLDAPNVMDAKPFLEVDLRTLDDRAIEDFWRVAHKGFDVEQVVEAAFELKYTKAIKRVLEAEFTNPSPEFVRHCVGKIYDGRITQSVIDRFTPFIRQAVNRTVSERISTRLRTALAHEESATQPTGEPQHSAEAEESGNDIVTTEEEVMAFYVIKSILVGRVDTRRVLYRDAKSYCAILLDDNNRKPIARLYFNGRRRSIGLFDKDKAETRVAIETIDDIYAHAGAIRARVAFMEEAPAKAEQEEATADA